MKRTLAWTAVLLVAAAGPAGAMEGKIRFSKGVPAALARAKQEQKPAALYFTADW
jgi:hypothetical protein